MIGSQQIGTRKVMMLGDIGVGKTSLTRRFVFNRFSASYKATIGVDIYTRDVGLQHNGGNAVCKLVIWDVDGDLGESIFNHIYFRGVSGCLIVGDATRPASWDAMVRLAQGMQEAAPGRPALFILNKIDLCSDLSALELPETIERAGHMVLQTSARTGENVEQAFSGLVHKLLEREL